MNSVQIIKEVIELIEENSDANLEYFMKHLPISKVHFRREFKKYTGISFQKYVNQRKLANSLSLLLNTRKRIIDIAMESNFKYEQSFIRAFKNEFGISPNQFRKNPRCLRITYKNFHDLKYIDQSRILCPIIEFIPSFSVFYEKTFEEVNGNATEIAFDFVKNYSFLIDKQISYFGITTEEGYTPAFYGLKSTPHSLTQFRLPAGIYLSFSYIGNHTYQFLNKKNNIEFINKSSSFLSTLEKCGYRFPMHYELVENKNCTSNQTILNWKWPIEIYDHFG
ncbi:helix-turn-helix transcriptional regulator [Facklamia sp. DSM 111018]|uniref:Helix-turn-helix transcriptional regulator n=1 Tax=Facklamia lactis TaxID=2749967 RepID=A0ABS0LN98_9LACT|nr:AraC family transcriptional regulator [Facklamia lactis]MBG9979716.1 helix-turn-helix transcriptional regulator [Facklamia lactis]MBG9985604.1 helix-turn-helix transcriptional regulator [Facklamia lactis]